MYSLNTNLGLWSTVVYRRNSHIRVAKVTIFLVSLRLSNPSRQSQTNTASDGQMLCQTARTDFSDSSTRSDMIQINQSWVCVVSLDSDRQHLETVGHDAIAPLDSKHAISKSDSTSFLYCVDSLFWHEQRFDESDSRLRRNICKCRQFKNVRILCCWFLGSSQNELKKTDFPTIKSAKFPSLNYA